MAVSVGKLWFICVDDDLCPAGADPASGTSGSSSGWRIWEIDGNVFLIFQVWGHFCGF